MEVMGYILVLDDNEEDLDVTQKYLSILDYKVEGAYSGEEGCRLFGRDQDCGLVITTMKLGNINGNDIARCIRNSTKPLTPIIAIGDTGDTIDQNLFNSVLMMPFKLKALGESVSSLMPPVARV